MDKTIARVNEAFILHSDLEAVCNQLALQQGKAVDASVKMDLLRELVLDKIFLSEALLNDVKIPKAYIQGRCEDRVASLIQRFGSEEKLVEAAGQPIYAFKKRIKEMIKSESLAQQTYAYITKEVRVTPAEVTAYFNRLSPNARPYYPAAVQVHQLVVYPKIDAKRQEAAKSKLLDLKKLLLNGVATFSELAKEHSDDFHSARKGGEIGWVPLGVLPPAYESTALSLKVGEVSDPIAFEFGWYLITLIGRNKDQYNTRHILKMLPPTEQEIEWTKGELNKIRSDIVAGKLTFEAAVQQYSEDKGTVAQAGLIKAPSQGGDLFPGLLIPVESLDPEVYFAIDGLKEGEVSAPQYMGTSARSACRLLYLKQRVAAHPMNLTQDYEKIYAHLLEEKKKEAVAKWIQTAKSKFVIEFSPEYSKVKELL
ncbi:foldase protein PrsA [Cardinium endosymbiont of Nabis limbatus]|uniref:peptidylprolyl isomerase n=1 Tax=Cardinium endosymbiont of Nabis limbatus TaxID=3066217 RepID=UPI003AF3E6E0